MGRILSAYECEAIKKLRNEFQPFAEKGWMCEGTDDVNGNLYNIIFNNDTDEWFKADYDGNIVESTLTTTPIAEAKEMAVLEGRIAKIVWK